MQTWTARIFLEFLY